VKWYSRPSVSEPRGARVVYDTEKSSPSTSDRTCATSVDLPEPEGAEMINRIPAMRYKQCNRWHRHKINSSNRRPQTSYE
jgi:hypothetical protein